MQRFAQLYARLDSTTSTRAKVDALVDYLQHTPPRDAAWGVYFLAGGKPRRGVSSTLLRQWAAQAAGVDDWLFEASYQAVGDLAETIAHLLPPAQQREDLGLADWMSERLLPLREWPPEQQQRCLMQWLRGLDWAGRFLLIKLIGGGFRVGMSRLLVIRGLAEHAGIASTIVAQRMMGYTDSRRLPSGADYDALIAPVAPGQEGRVADDPLLGAAQANGQPFPFFLAHALPPDMPEDPTGMLGPVADWVAEWKFDGIRAQIVRHGGQTWIWSRGEDLVTEQFPDIAEAAQRWPDGTILDGEIVVRQDPLPLEAEATAASETTAPPPRFHLPVQPAAFARLQLRLGRRNVSRKMLGDCPAAFIAYDVLGWEGRDLRREPMAVRRTLLEGPVAGQCGVHVSPRIDAASWLALAEARRQARPLGVEGLMLKHVESRYGVGRTKSQGTWWKWKVDPLSVDAVLIYAQAGHGRRASLFTDYTFAVWNRPPRDAEEARAVVAAIERREPPTEGGLQLVTFAKAYSGLNDEEIRAVDRIVRRDTVEKFGPVCSLRPTQVFEIGFEGINDSGRHKSGVAVRFPRILRWRQDKPLHEADTLGHLRALAHAPPPTAG